MEKSFRMYKSFWIILLLLNSFKSYSIPCPTSFDGGGFVESDTKLIDTESSLLAQGFSKRYVDRFNEAIRLIGLKKHWQKIQADPDIKHLPYFAQKVDAHIQEIQRGIETSELPVLEKRARLRVLKALKREAHIAKKIYKVTYNWWHIFNVRLIALVTTPIEEAFYLGLSLDQINSHQVVYRRVQEKRGSLHAFRGPYVQMMEKFPSIVLSPTVGDIGIMAFNQTVGERVHFLGVSGTHLDVDGGKLSPPEVYQHDIEHADSIEEYLQNQDLSFHAQFKIKIQRFIVDFREPQELAYYLLTRERGNLKADDNAIFEKSLGRMLDRHYLVYLLPEVIRNREYESRKEAKEVLQMYFRDIESNYNAISQEIRNSN